MLYEVIDNNTNKVAVTKGNLCLVFSEKKCVQERAGVHVLGAPGRSADMCMWWHLLCEWVWMNVRNVEGVVCASSCSAKIKPKT